MLISAQEWLTMNSKYVLREEDADALQSVEFSYHAELTVKQVATAVKESYPDVVLKYPPKVKEEETSAGTND